MDHRSQVQVGSGLSVVAALWLIASPWALGFAPLREPMTDAVAVGAVVGVLALIRLLATVRTDWLSWVNALAAVWLVVSPWVLGFTADRNPFWNALVLGLIVFVLSVYAAMPVRPREPVGAR